MITFFYLACFSLLASSMPLDKKQNSPLPLNSSDVSAIEGQPLDDTQTYVSIEDLGYKLISVPDDVKKNLQPPFWLALWEDAEFVSVIGHDGIPLGANTANLTIKAAAYLASMTGGVWMTQNTTYAKRGELNVEEQLLEYLNTGQQHVLQPLQQLEMLDSLLKEETKRANACFWRNGWTRSRSNVAMASALTALSNLITGSCNWLVLGRSAICGTNGDGQNACVSWDGGWQTMKGCVAKAVLDSAANTFGHGNEDISAYCSGCLHTWNFKRSNQYDDQACVSNRPDGCSGHSWSARFNWDNDAYGWCAFSPY